jgi:ribosomal protein S18 acetylase RimI-like enzyme
MEVRPLNESDVGAIVARVQRRLQRDATSNPLLNPTFDDEIFSNALGQALDATWVAIIDGEYVGHIYGAILESSEYGNGAWIGPDGVSFDNTEILAALYAEAGTQWIDHGAMEHYAWVFDAPDDTQPWFELGFARMHARGVLALNSRGRHTLPAGYLLRRGGPSDLILSIELDKALDLAQQRGPSFSLGLNHASRSEELLETLEDNEVHHYVVEYQGAGIAQCLTFPLDARRGSFEKTLHVSAVTVLPEHEHRGIATAMIDHALNNALEAGFEYVETNWRVTNRRAAKFWVRYGFSPTYVRLHRTIGSA